MKLNYDTIMAVADSIYSEMRETEGRPQVHDYGIQSSQIKAVCQAMVEAINEILEHKE